MLVRQCATRCSDVISTDSRDPSIASTVSSSRSLLRGSQRYTPAINKRIAKFCSSRVTNLSQYSDFAVSVRRHLRQLTMSTYVHDLASFSDAVGVLMIPAIEDNYMYILFDKATKVAAAIDPVEAPRLAAVVKKVGLDLKMILTTHSHWDHDGGNAELVKLFPGISVFGGKGDKAKAVTKEVADGDAIELGNLKVSVLFTPCHTPGHVCYYVVGESGPGVVFTGDTLFIGGCGNFNTGTPKQMFEAFQKLSKLPAETLVCCGHEYTSANLAYARFVEPDNNDLRKKSQWVAERRKANLPTIPSTLQEEAATNPFWRVRLCLLCCVPLRHCFTSACVL